MSLQLPAKLSYVTVTGFASGAYSVLLNPSSPWLVNNQTMHPHSSWTNLTSYPYGVPLFLADLDPDETYNLTITYLGLGTQFLNYSKTSVYQYRIYPTAQSVEEFAQKLIVGLVIGCVVVSVRVYSRT